MNQGTKEEFAFLPQRSAWNLFERQEIFFNINQCSAERTTFLWDIQSALQEGRSDVKKGVEIQGWLKHCWGFGTWSGTHMVGDSKDTPVEFRHVLQTTYAPRQKKARGNVTSWGSCQAWLAAANSKRKNVVGLWEPWRGCNLKGNILWKLPGLTCISLRGKWATFSTIF